MNPNRAKELITFLQSHSDASKAEKLQQFFRTKKGEYGEGDQFIGVKVPLIRSTVRKFADLGFAELEELIHHPIHEIRMAGVIILVTQYQKAKDSPQKTRIAEFYLKHRAGLNNWDLIDISAPKILGDYYLSRDKSLLYDFAKSGTLWEQRIAVLTTFGFIRQDRFEDALKISELLLHHPHHLIHKAVGWMLREIGNRDHTTEVNFLTLHYKNMPRTMLRYAIEKFEKNERDSYLKGLV